MKNHGGECTLSISRNLAGRERPHVICAQAHAYLCASCGQSFSPAAAEQEHADWPYCISCTIS